VCPRLKSRGGQRRSGSHMRWGSESGLGRPPLDLFLLATIQDQDQVRMGPPPTGEAGTRARQWRYCFLLVVAMRCDAMIQSDKWAPWAKRRQRVLQNMRCTCFVYVAGFSLAGFALCRQVICCAIVGRFARLNMCGASADCMWQPRKVATQQTVTVGLMWKVSSLPDTTTCGTSGLSSTP
jgi:hypothetical protein